MKRLGILLGMLMLVGNSFSDVINVPLGTSADIQAAIDGADTGDTIQLAAGTYEIISTIEISDFPFPGSKSLKIIGNGPGVTILDGGESQQVFNFGFFETVTVESLSIYRGKSANGGGLYAFVPLSLTLKNVNVSNCEASADGGGIFVSSGSFNLEKVYFESNSADGNGGGLYFDNALNGNSLNCVVDKTSFNANSAGGNGAAVNFYIGSGSASLSFVNSTLGNHSVGSGTIYVVGSGSLTLTMKNNTIANNGVGGLSINNASYNITQNNNIIVDNSAYDVSSSGNIIIGGDRNLLESTIGGVSYNGENYYEPFPDAVVETTFALNGGGTVPTLDLTEYGVRVAAGRARNKFPVDDQNGTLRRDRSELGAIETDFDINVWLGEDAANQDWADPVNWTSNLVPSTEDYVIIDNCSNANYPINSGTVYLVDLQVIVGNFGALENTGAFFIKKVFLQSNPNGTGQLLNNGLYFGTVEIEQYLFGNQWNFLGIPITSIDVNSLIPGASLGTSTWGGSSYSYSAGDYWVFEHDEMERANNGHSDAVWKSVNSGVLDGGKGYIVWCDNAQKAVFNGSVVSPGMSHSPIYTDAGEESDRGWNLLSNPYLCPFSWDGAVLDDVDQASYFYDNAFQNYFVVPGDPVDGSTELIPQVQAFFAKANKSGGELKMLSTLLAINTDVSFKRAALEDKHYLKAILFRDSEKYFDETYIRHKEGGMLSYEGDKDAYKMKALSDASPQIYTKGMGTDMTINSFSYYDYPNQELPLYVKVPEIDTFKLAFKIDDSMGDFEYTLEDKLEGNFYALNNQDTLAFSMEKLVEKDRFVIHVISTATFAEDVTKQQVLIYSSNNIIYLKTSEEYNIGTVNVYDLTGKLLFRKDLSSDNTSIDMNNMRGQLVLVSYESGGKSFRQKLILN